MSNSMQPQRWQPTRLPHPWDSPGKNTGVGCHFLLQCMKVKSESEVSQSCPTPSDPMDCSLPGSSVHGIFQARVLEWGAIAFSNWSLLKLISIESVMPSNHLNPCHLFLLLPSIFPSIKSHREDSWPLHHTSSSQMFPFPGPNPVAHMASRAWPQPSC